jgi:hypothetical protein
MKQPRSIEEWEESIDNDRKGKRGNFRILERGMFNSKAFLELSKKPTHVLVFLAAMNQVEYEKRDKNSNRQVLRNGGRIYLPQNMLKARGVNSNATIAEAKKTIVELGFLDVMETGSVNHASIFQMSYRWQKYPDGDYRPNEHKSCTGRLKSAEGGGRKVRHLLHD